MNQLSKRSRLVLLAMLLVTFFILSYLPAKVQAQVDNAKYGLGYDIQTGEVWQYIEYNPYENMVMSGVGNWPEGFTDVDMYILLRDGKHEGFGLGLYTLPDNHPLANRPPYSSVANVPLFYDYIYYTLDLEKMEFRKMDVEEFIQKYQGHPDEIEEMKSARYQGFDESENEHVVRWWTYDCYFRTSSQVFDVRSLEGGTKLRIQVAGPIGTTGFLRLEIPNEIVPCSPEVKVFVDDVEVSHTITENDDFFSIYAEYVHSERTIDIGPFGIILPSPGIDIFMLISIVAISVAASTIVLLVRRRRSKA